METLRRYRVPIIGGFVVAAVVAFLLFRPDKLFVDDVVDESLEEAFAAPADADPAPPSAETTTTTPTATTGPDTTAPSTTPVTEATTTTAPSGPVALATGAFYGIDHSASGTATIYEQDGRHVLRFEEDTDIQNGPDLYVWVLADDDFGGAITVDYIDLGKLKGSIGGQNYELPPEFDPAVHRAVLIWCLRFRVPFAAAPLT